jgi:aryl-alcohol dehydrogenase-like predicted oxidoreductase
MNFAGLDYSLSPKVLEDQISASLERLGLEQVDLLMLHNPEQLLEVHPVPFSDIFLLIILFLVFFVYLF